LIIFAQYEWQFLLGFFGLGAAMAGYQMSSTTMVLEFGQRDDIPMRLALSTTAESVMAVVGPLLGGLIAALAGLMPVFIISIVFLLAALLILVNKVRDPRHVIT
ncbi:MAG: hypothetical protein JKY66_04335, partial [Spongiibacteraceae bacterium]|nr:hypothetical protein [Spongiibacteraceae bacterium]